MSRLRPTPSVELALALSGLAGAALGLAIQAASPSTGIPLAAAVGAVGLAIALAVALLWPEVGLGLSLAYVASPLSFYVQLRSTEPGSPYPATSDLAIDAVVVLALAGAAAAGAGLRSWSVREPLLRELPVRRPLVAIAIVLCVAGIIGLAVRNPLRPLLSDVVPFAEVGLLLLLTVKLVDDRRKLVTLLWVVGAALAATAILKAVLYAQGPGTFGVESISLEGTARPRLYQNYAFGWFLPFAVVCVLFAQTLRRGLPALAFTLLAGLMVLLSFERGLWVFAAVATLPVVAYGLWYRPRVAVPLAAAGAITLVLAGGLLGGGSGFEDPLSLVRERLAGTTDQLHQRSGIGRKRQDEATALWRTIRDTPSGWPLGNGLGAEYVGPTGIHEGDYAESFRKKHYSFNWYLALLFRTGVVGLAVGVWLIVALGAVGWRAFRRSPQRAVCAAGLALVSAVAGLALVAPIDPYLLAHPLAALQGATVAGVAFAARSAASRGDG